MKIHGFTRPFDSFHVGSKPINVSIPQSRIRTDSYEKVTSVTCYSKNPYTTLASKQQSNIQTVIDRLKSNEWSQKLDAYRIAAKVSRGDYVSDKEKRRLATTNTELSQKAAMANHRRKGLENRLKYADKKGAKSIIRYERFSSLSMLDYASSALYGESLNKTAKKCRVYA